MEIAQSHPDTLLKMNDAQSRNHKSLPKDLERKQAEKRTYRNINKKKCQ